MSTFLIWSSFERQMQNEHFIVNNEMSWVLKNTIPGINNYFRQPAWTCPWRFHVCELSIQNPVFKHVVQKTKTKSTNAIIEIFCYLWFSYFSCNCLGLSNSPNVGKIQPFSSISLLLVGRGLSNFLFYLDTKSCQYLNQINLI